MDTPIPGVRGMAVEIIPVWNKVGPELQAELARFWIDHKAMLDESKAAERAAQVVCIARDGDKLVGVSTAYPRIVPLLRQPMYYYRNYISPAYRSAGLSIPFINQSFDEIERQEAAKEKALCIGVILSIENQRLVKHYDQARWWQSGFVYAGISRDNAQLRVKYFEGARLRPPAQLKPRAKAAAQA
jgi:hypothetical protein